MGALLGYALRRSTRQNELTPRRTVNATWRVPECPNARTEQDDWRIAGSQRKAAPRRAYLQDIVGLYAVMKIRADNPVRLSFDIHPIVLAPGMPDIE
jgi:hypothetical protein